MKVVPFIQEKRLATGLIVVIMIAVIAFFCFTTGEPPSESRSGPSR